MKPDDPYRLYREPVASADRRRHALMQQRREQIEGEKRLAAMTPEERLDLEVEELMEGFEGTERERRHRTSVILHRQGR